MPKKILIAEDDPLTAVYLNQILTALKFKVVGLATHSQQAIELARTQKPDLITMDIVWNDPCDGIETARRIKRELNIPVVFISGTTIPKVLERAKRVLPLGYILKPFNRDQIAVTMEMALYKHKYEHEREKRKALERKFAARLLASQEEERRWLSQDIHDSLGPLLTVLKINLSSLHKQVQDSPPLAEKVSAMLDLLNLTTQEMRVIFNKLTPTLLEHLGLVAAAEWLVNEFQKNNPLQFESEISLADGALTLLQSISLFRVMQEALNNIVKHAQASQVRVHLYQAKHQVHLSIVDNGIGFKPPKQPSQSLGIWGMRERINACGGKLTLSHPRQGGTLVQANIPLPPKR